MVQLFSRKRKVKTNATTFKQPISLILSNKLGIRERRQKAQTYAELISAIVIFKVFLIVFRFMIFLVVSPCAATPKIFFRLVLVK